jgi:hypothetical protein
MADLRAGISGALGVFDDPNRLLRAAEALRDDGWERWDCHTPYPVHGLEKAMGIRDSLIPVLTLAAAFCGALTAKGMQWYMSDYDFPLMVGGKPLFSLPAFVPVTFELFVLFAALVTFGAILMFCRLGRWHSPLHDAGLMERATSDRFVVYLDASDKRYDEQRVRELLETHGCEEIRIVAAESEQEA